MVHRQTDESGRRVAGSSKAAKEGVMKILQRWRRVHSFAADLRCYPALTQHEAGYASVPVCEIVGSVGRDRELARDFLPYHRPIGQARRSERFQRVYELTMEGAALPPILLNRLGDRYYVVDGHHRVAAARAVGQLEIDAVVTEYSVAGPGSELWDACTDRKPRKGFLMYPRGQGGLRRWSF